MDTIEERANHAFPDEYPFFRQRYWYLSCAKERRGYIKACEEYESLPKIHGWVATCSPNLFIDFSLPEASEILEKAGFKHGDKVEILIRKV